MKTKRSLTSSKLITRTIFAMVLLVFSAVSLASKTMKPYILASISKVEHKKSIKDTRASLEKAGFTIVGSYTPYKDAHIIIVTNKLLKEMALNTPFGGFGTTQRISVTLVNDEVQVAYTNPEYMFNAYRMKGSLSVITTSLKNALGGIKEFGASSGLTAKALRKYHYKIFMPYFNEPIVNAKFSSYEQAIKTVEGNLAKNAGGASKVYRVDLGNKKTVIGVHLTKGCGGDKLVMSRIDKNKIRSTAHLPYELLVKDNKVMALHAKFRIAISFPSLSMIGRNSFYSIMCAPNSISKALSKVAGK